MWIWYLAMNLYSAKQHEDKNVALFKEDCNWVNSDTYYSPSFLIHRYIPIKIRWHTDFFSNDALKFAPTISLLLINYIS